MNQPIEYFLINQDVVEHFPPNIIIGRGLSEQVVRVIDDDPLVSIAIIEVTNEWQYSNPTGLFNLSLPRVYYKYDYYTSIYYSDYKKN